MKLRLPNLMNNVADIYFGDRVTEETFAALRAQFSTPSLTTQVQSATAAVAAECDTGRTHRRVRANRWGTARYGKVSATMPAKP